MSFSLKPYFIPHAAPCSVERAFKWTRIVSLSVWTKATALSQRPSEDAEGGGWWRWGGKDRASEREGQGSRRQAVDRGRFQFHNDQSYLSKLMARITT